MTRHRRRTRYPYRIPLRLRLADISPAEVAWRRIGCPLLGHRWRDRMRGQVCTRCRTRRPLPVSGQIMLHLTRRDQVTGERS